MPAQRQDYILAQIDLLRQFIARLLARREKSGIHEALNQAMNLQEKLFAMPPAEFLQLEVSAQIASLTNGESKSAGQQKCLTYVQLLKETATLYEFSGRSDLALGARQLALHVALNVALDSADASPTAALPLIDELRATLPEGELHPPVRELLAEFDARS